MKPLLSNSLPPGEYRTQLVDLFFERFRTKFDDKQIIHMAELRYDENFTDEEIKGLIQFYQTPLGQNMVHLLPKLTSELQQDGQGLGRKAGQEAMQEVLAEHPDLAQAMQEAARGGASPAH